MAVNKSKVPQKKKPKQQMQQAGFITRNDALKVQKRVKTSSPKKKHNRNI